MNHRASVLALCGLSMLLTACGDGGGDPGQTVDAGLATDQCLSASDMEIVLASRTDGGMGADAAVPNPLSEAYACALTPTCYNLYFNEMDEEGLACVHDCLADAPSGALSLGCLDCYAGEARTCAASNCLIPCIGDDTALCNACFQEFCQDRLTACIGY